jgi:hypothetical protein
MEIAIVMIVTAIAMVIATVVVVTATGVGKTTTGTTAGMAITAVIQRIALTKRDTTTASSIGSTGRNKDSARGSMTMTPMLTATVITQRTTAGEMETAVGKIEMDAGDADAVMAHGITVALTGTVATGTVATGIVDTGTAATRARVT